MTVYCDGWTASRNSNSRIVRPRWQKSTPCAKRKLARRRCAPKSWSCWAGSRITTGPLNARVTGRIDRPRYTIEKVIFESLPQFYVAANLYLPKEGGKHPGVLRPMGHWEEGKVREQVMDANLAMKGFVVLTYDPIGQGERQQAYDSRIEASLIGGSTDQHFQAGAQSILAGENFARYRIWDAKRALDYLVSRPEVDADKIGVTGCSGGGTLTTYISALDPRVKVAAPACYINTWHYLFAGPTGDSEQSFPFFLSSGLDVADYIETLRAQTLAGRIHGRRFLSHRRRPACLSGSSGLVPDFQC